MTSPTHISINGHEYEINTSWQAGVECTRLIADTNIDDTERSIRVIVTLLGEDAPYMEQETLDKVTQYMQCEKDTKSDGSDPVLDYTVDNIAIWSSIKAQYGVDLNKDSVTWYEYNHMIEGLSGKSRMMEIVQLRQYDLREVKDPKERAKIKKAQDSVRLKKPIMEQHPMTKAFLDQLNQEG